MTMMLVFGLYGCSREDDICFAMRERVYEGRLVKSVVFLFVSLGV